MIEDKNDLVFQGPFRARCQEATDLVVPRAYMAKLEAVSKWPFLGSSPRSMAQGIYLWTTPDLGAGYCRIAYVGKTDGNPKRCFGKRVEEEIDYEINGKNGRKPPCLDIEAFLRGERKHVIPKDAKDEKRIKYDGIDLSPIFVCPLQADAWRFKLIESAIIRRLRTRPETRAFLYNTKPSTNEILPEPGVSVRSASVMFEGLDGVVR